MDLNSMLNPDPEGMDGDLAKGFDDVMEKGKCKGMSLREAIKASPYSVNWYVDNDGLVLKDEVMQALLNELYIRSEIEEEKTSHYDNSEWDQDYSLPF